MAIVQISKIQIRTGEKSDLPILSPGEFGYATDTKQLFIGNENATAPEDNTQIITDASAFPAPGEPGQVIFNDYGDIKGSPNLTFDSISGLLKITGDLEVTGTITGNLDVNNIDGILDVEKGGTGVETVTGYLKGNGTDPFSGVEKIPAADISGTLAIANGGTGKDSFVAGYVKSNGTELLTSTTVAGADVSGNITGNAANVTGTVAIANGGTGQTTQQAAINALSGTQSEGTVLRSDGTNVTLSKVALSTDVSGTLPIGNGGTGQTSFASGYIKSNGTALSSSASISGSDINGDITGNAGNVTGIVAIVNGGTGASERAAGLNNLLPDQSGNENKYLLTDGTNVSWVTLNLNPGTVTSIDVSGGLTGLTTSGGPITSSGTITLAGTLAISNGGTGKTSFTSGYIKSTGTALTSSATVAGSDVLGDISGNSGGVTTITSGTDDQEHYLMFVDSNNTTAEGETVYTNDNIKFNTQTNVLTVGGPVIAPEVVTASIYFIEEGKGDETDLATIRVESTTGDDLKMTFTMANDEDDYFDFIATSNDGLKMNGFTVWHEGNDGKTSGLDADLLQGMGLLPLESTGTGTIPVRDQTGKINTTTFSGDTLELGPINTLAIRPCVTSSRQFSFTGAPNTQLDTFETTDFRTVKYLIQVSTGSNFHSSEVLLVHNNTNVFTTEYAVIETGSSLYSVSASLSGTTVSVMLTLTSTGATTVTMHKTMLRKEV